MATKQLRCLWVLLVLFSIVLGCPEDTLFLIKPTVNEDLVLDAKDPSQIRLQKVNGSSGQLWRFVPGDRIGLFYIVNNQTGEAIDFRPSSNPGIMNLVAKEKMNALHQQWAWALRGRISNAENRFNIDVYWGNFEEGNSVVIHGDNGSSAQEFIVEKFEPDQYSSNNKK